MEVSAVKYGVSVKLRSTLEWRSLPGLVFDTSGEARKEVVRINATGKADGADVVVAVVRSVSTGGEEDLIFKVERTCPAQFGLCLCGATSVSWLVEGLSNGYVDVCPGCVQGFARDVFDEHCHIELGARS